MLEGSYPTRDCSILDIAETITAQRAGQGTNKRLMRPQASILELFARRQPAYARADIMRLLGITEAQLASAIQEGVLTPEQDDTGAEVIPWEDVATLALESWTPRMIDAALGKHATSVLPPLNQHRIIPVALPAYLIRFVNHLARQRPGHNASDIIESLLHEQANTEALTIEIPGFHEAVRYPYYTHRNGAAWRCRYCDTVVTSSRTDVCRSCKERHEPRGER